MRTVVDELPWCISGCIGDKSNTDICIHIQVDQRVSTAMETVILILIVSMDRRVSCVLLW